MEYKVITQKLIPSGGSFQTKIVLTMPYDDWSALETSKIWSALCRFLDNRKKQDIRKHIDCDQAQ